MAETPKHFSSTSSSVAELTPALSGQLFSAPKKTVDTVDISLDGKTNPTQERIRREAQAFLAAEKPCMSEWLFTLLEQEIVGLLERHTQETTNLHTKFMQVRDEIIKDPRNKRTLDEMLAEVSAQEQSEQWEQTIDNGVALVSLTPAVGNAIGTGISLYEAWMGRKLTGRELGDAERALAMASVTLSLVNGGRAASTVASRALRAGARELEHQMVKPTREPHEPKTTTQERTEPKPAPKDRWAEWKAAKTDVPVDEVLANAKLSPTERIAKAKALIGKFGKEVEGMILGTHEMGAVYDNRAGFSKRETFEPLVNSEKISWRQVRKLFDYGIAWGTPEPKVLFTRLIRNIAGEEQFFFHGAEGIPVSPLRVEQVLKGRTEQVHGVFDTKNTPNFFPRNEKGRSILGLEAQEWLGHQALLYKKVALYLERVADNPSNTQPVLEKAANRTHVVNQAENLANDTLKNMKFLLDKIGDNSIIISNETKQSIAISAERIFAVKAKLTTYH